METKLQVWQTNLIGVLACALLSGAGYLFIVRPVAEQQLSLERTRSQWDAQRQRSNDLDNTRRSLIGELKEARGRLDQSQVQLQSIDRLNKRVADLTRLAGECDLALHETNSGRMTSSGLYDMVSIHLQGSGSFAEAVHFLHLLRESMPDTGLAGMRLSGNPRDSAIPVSYEFDLVWYTAPSVATIVE